MAEMEMMRTAFSLAGEVLGVKAGERVLIVTDEIKQAVGRVLALACRALGAETVLAWMPATGEHGNEPPQTIAAAMRAAEVVLAPTSQAITHTRARLEASRAGARVAILRGVDEEMMIRGGMTVDFGQLRERNERLRQALAGADRVEVTSAAGTEVSFSVAGRRFFSLDGFYHQETGFAALPPGEVPTSPVEGTTNGTIVFDYSMDSLGRLSQPLALTVRAGQVESVAGGAREVQALERLFQGDESARNIAEFAIGTNPRARLIGNLAEDKKLLGTVHFAIGDNLSLGGSVESSIHFDGLMLAPTVTVDGRVLVQEGRLLIEEG